MRKCAFSSSRLRGALGLLEHAPMRPRIARICLIVAAVLFISGSLVLCACPGWYALAVAFAAVATGLGTSRTRFWATLTLVASIVLTGVHTYAKIQEHHRNIERRQRLNPQRKQEARGPNHPAPSDAGIASRLTIGLHWLGAPEPERSANQRLP